MASVVEHEDLEKIHSLLSKINEVWLQGQTEALNDCFHNDVVIRGPDFRETAAGREACVKSYEDFLRAATVKGFKASEPVVDRFGSTAVAIVPWEIRYRMNDCEYHESGHDLFVLTSEEGQWRVVWRAVLPSRQT